MHGCRRLVRVAALSPSRGVAVCEAFGVDRYGVFGSSRCCRLELSAAIAKTCVGLAPGCI